MNILKDFSRSGELFLIGILFGTLFSILSELYFEFFTEATQVFLEFRLGAFPTDSVFRFLIIFLNNLVVVLFASIGSAGLIILMLWGRDKFPFWQRLNNSKLGEKFDHFVWRIVEWFHPKFKTIKKKINRDIFIICYGMPTLVMIVNGWFIGFFFGNSFCNAQLVGALEFLKLVLPHGIVEIPTLLASAALGYSIAGRVSNPLYQGETQKAKKRVRSIVKDKRIWKILSIIFLYLGIAAFIESFITPLIVF